MRYVQILIPDGKRDAILTELDEQGIDYAVTEETGRHGYSGIASFPLPMGAVEPILDRLRHTGVEETAFTIVQKPETVVSHRFEALKERYPKDELAREELVARAEEMAPNLSTFLIMTGVSAIIATTGLLQNSAAVIIGAMVVAPLMGPAMAASVGTVVNDPKLAYRGVRFQVVGILLAIFCAAVFAWIIKQTVLTPPGLDITAIPEVQQRLAPDFLSLVVAVGAGVAAVVSLARGVSSVLVGAMIAVALVPPAATVGLGMAWGEPLVMLGAGVLLLVNVISINLVALFVFWAFGFRPQEWLQVGTAKSATLKKMAAMVVMLMVLSIFMAFGTYVSYQEAAFEENAKKTTRDVFNLAKYDEMKLLEFSIRASVVDVLFFGGESELVALVDRPAGADATGLAETIDRQVSKRTDFNVRVQVRFVEVEET